MARGVALVTGGARGIGRAILEGLALDHGCMVHCRRHIKAAEEAAASLRERGPGRWW